MRRTPLLFNRSDLHSAFPEADGAWIAGLEDALLAAQRPGALRQPRADEARPRRGRRPGGVPRPRRRPRRTSRPAATCDPELAAIPRPRLGFFGGLDDYVVDFDLLAARREENPDASLVLDRGRHLRDGRAAPRCPTCTGSASGPYDAIPAFGRGFDVALMPWLDNEWIRFANPIKLKEYLALGLPVVCTDYPEVEAYRDRVTVADGPRRLPGAGAARTGGAARRARPARLRGHLLLGGAGGGPRPGRRRRGPLTDRAQPPAATRRSTASITRARRSSGVFEADCTCTARSLGRTEAMSSSASRSSRGPVSQ